MHEQKISMFELSQRELMHDSHLPRDRPEKKSPLDNAAKGRLLSVTTESLSPTKPGFQESEESIEIEQPPKRVLKKSQVQVIVVRMSGYACKPCSHSK